MHTDNSFLICVALRCLCGFQIPRPKLFLGHSDQIIGTNPSPRSRPRRSTLQRFIRPRRSSFLRIEPGIDRSRPRSLENCRSAEEDVTIRSFFSAPSKPWQSPVSLFPPKPDQSQDPHRFLERPRLNCPDTAANRPETERPQDSCDSPSAPTSEHESGGPGRRDRSGIHREQRRGSCNA